MSEVPTERTEGLIHRNFIDDLIGVQKTLEAIRSLSSINGWDDTYHFKDGLYLEVEFGEEVAAEVMDEHFETLPSLVTDGLTCTAFKIHWPAVETDPGILLEFTGRGTEGEYITIYAEPSKVTDLKIVESATDE